MGRERCRIASLRKGELPVLPVEEREEEAEGTVGWAQVESTGRERTLFFFRCL
jgi:hypothetical protein